MHQYSAKAVDYAGLGTVEESYDRRLEVYFMEMKHEASG
jgi:biotin carboxylase